MAPSRKLSLVPRKPHSRRRVNPIKNRTRMCKFRERILYAVDVRIGNLALALKDANFQLPKPTIPRSARHCIPPH